MEGINKCICDSDSDSDSDSDIEELYNEKQPVNMEENNKENSMKQLGGNITINNNNIKAHMVIIVGMSILLLLLVVFKSK